MEVELKLLVAPEHLARHRPSPGRPGRAPGWRAEARACHRLLRHARERSRARRRGAAPASRRQPLDPDIEGWRRRGGGTARARRDRVGPLAATRSTSRCSTARRTPSSSRSAKCAAACDPSSRRSSTRAARTLAFPDGTLAELALDRGVIRAGRHEAPISEAEIELKGGDPARLFALARAIAHDVPLRLGHASKAARGYALGHGAAPPAEGPGHPARGDA